MTTGHGSTPVSGSPDRLEEVFGRRVRQYRLQADLTAAELASRTGLSAGMISRIESASTSASLTSIHRIATALDVQVSALFRGVGGPRGAVFTKAGEGTASTRAGSKTGHRYYALGALFSNVGPSLEPVLVELDENTTELPTYEHPGIEFLYVVRGAMRFAHGDDEYEMRSGDSLLLDAEAPHGVVELLETPVCFLSVNPLRA